MAAANSGEMLEQSDELAANSSRMAALQDQIALVSAKHDAKPRCKQWQVC